MTLLAAVNISLNFLENQIFREIGFQVEPADRIGLIGPNGSGKTTLLRLVQGEIAPDTGEIHIARGTRLGYLPQDIQEAETGPLLETVIHAIPGRRDLGQARKDLEAALKAATDQENQESLAKSLAEVHQSIHDQDAAFPLHEAERILLGLGFKPDDFPTPVSDLSGGWKMRAALAGLLYRKPDMLLLDEPTNHLDIPSVRWLEGFLQDFKGAMLLVSHDREFLNRQVGRIISLEPEGMRFYSGNYDFYLRARQEEERILEARARNQQQKIKEARKFIERFRAKASKARQAQSKIKLVKKMALVETRQREKTIHFHFPRVPRSGRKVITLRGVNKQFDGKPLYHDLDLTVLRGERIAVIGPNGAGKTTLLRMVAGEIPPTRGEITPGHAVSMSYFAQHHSDMLDPHKAIIEEVYQVIPEQTVGFVRNVCGAFLFSGNEVDKPVGVLSGGERARVSLAKLLVQPGNFMVMDEPTNHLDLQSSEKLIDALEGYTGTLLFVSHNQSFINRLATKIWDIRNKEIIEYPGNLDEYYDHLSRREADSATEGGTGQGEGKPESGPGVSAPPGRADKKKADKKKLRRVRARRRQQIQAALQPILSGLKDLEERITRLESRQEELEKTLADPGFFKDKDRSVPLLNEYNDNRDRLERLIARWEGEQDRLESTKKELGV